MYIACFIVIQTLFLKKTSHEGFNGNKSKSRHFLLHGPNKELHG